MKRTAQKISKNTARLVQSNPNIPKQNINILLCNFRIKLFAVLQDPLILINLFKSCINHSTIVRSKKYFSLYRTRILTMHVCVDELDERVLSNLYLTHHPLETCRYPSTDVRF